MLSNINVVVNNLCLLVVCLQNEDIRSSFAVFDDLW
jgi:hypothetical protein